MFFKSQQTNDLIRSRENALSNLEIAYKCYTDILANISDGSKFYADIMTLIKSLRNNCEVFCSNRNSEMRNMEMRLAQQQFSNMSVQPSRMPGEFTPHTANAPQISNEFYGQSSTPYFGGESGASQSSYGSNQGGIPGLGSIGNSQDESSNKRNIVERAGQYAVNQSPGNHTYGIAAHNAGGVHGIRFENDSYGSMRPPNLASSVPNTQYGVAPASHPFYSSNSVQPVSGVQTQPQYRVQPQPQYGIQPSTYGIAPNSHFGKKSDSEYKPNQ